MYDIEIVYPVSCKKNSYRQRFIDLKRYGLVNVKDKKVLVKLLVGTEEIAYPTKGWHENIDVEAVKSLQNWPAAKMADYYGHITKEDLGKSRWFAKIDDDSVTDVSALVTELDLEFDYQREYYVVTELCKERHDPEIGLLNRLGYGRWFRPGARPLIHEWEGSVVSQAALMHIANTTDAVEFMRLRSKIDQGPGDLFLAYAARMAKIYPSETNFMSKDPLVHDFTLFGGNYSHIHYLSHDINPFRFERYKVMIDKTRQEELPRLYKEICDKDYVFCRDTHNVIGILQLLPNGRIGGYRNYNEAFREVTGDELQFLTEDLRISSVFYLDEEKGYDVIEGVFLFEENAHHSLRRIL